MCCRSEWQERMYIYKWHEVDQTKHEIFCVHIVCNEIQVKVNLEITTFFFYLRFPYCPNFFWFGVVVNSLKGACFLTVLDGLHQHTDTCFKYSSDQKVWSWGNSSCVLSWLSSELNRFFLNNAAWSYCIQQHSPLKYCSISFFPSKYLNMYLA